MGDDSQHDRGDGQDSEKRVAASVCPGGWLARVVITGSEGDESRAEEGEDVPGGAGFGGVVLGERDSLHV